MWKGWRVLADLIVLFFLLLRCSCWFADLLFVLYMSVREFGQISRCFHFFASAALIDVDVLLCFRCEVTVSHFSNLGCRACGKLFFNALGWWVRKLARAWLLGSSTCVALMKWRAFIYCRSKEPQAEMSMTPNVRSLLGHGKVGRLVPFCDPKALHPPMPSCELLSLLT